MTGDIFTPPGPRYGENQMGKHCDAYREAQENRLIVEALASVVRDERLRQIEAEGWSPEHDATHTGGELARAAACYALGRDVVEWNNARSGAKGDPLWPWEPKGFKPKDRIDDLVRAGALILAEIERLQRIISASPTPSEIGWRQRQGGSEA